MSSGAFKLTFQLAGCLLALSSGHHLPGAESISSSVREQLLSTLDKAESMRNADNPEGALSIAQTALRQAEGEGFDTVITEALFQISIANYFLEEYEEARAYMEIGLTHARLHDLSALEGDFLNAQGVLEWKQGNLFEASAKLEEALKVKQGLGEWTSIASIANNLGNIAYSLERYSEAVAFYEKGLEWLGNRENRRLRASLLSNLGESLIPLGEFQRAETSLLQSLEMEKEGGDAGNLAYTYFNLGELRAAEDNSDKAIALYRKALDLQLSVESSWAAALTRLRLSTEHLKTRDTDRALAVLQPGFEAVKELNALTLLRDYADQYARLHDASGNSGLSRYYKDLHDWFVQRISTDTLTFEEAVEEMASPGGKVPTTAPSAGAGFFNVSFQRMTALILLLILIMILVGENIRLRRLVRQR